MTFFVVKSKSGKYVDMSSGYPFLTTNIFGSWVRHSTAAKAFGALKYAAGVVHGELEVVEMDLVEIMVLDETNTKSGFQWLAEYDLHIMDPDGWRHNDGVTMETPITLPDFLHRFIQCTVMIPNQDSFERLKRDAALIENY